ncbi:hypothetical protein ACLEE4_00825 [Lonsdalea quercina]|uniref:hypothetical protein n=1 Tax=Lonsdalea quercina TaxID=71657 RepID=UPI0039754B5A
MDITVGNSFLTASISSDRINEMLMDHTQPHLTLWERIKDFFCTTGQREALACLFKLCHPSPEMTSGEVESIFFRLKELASPGYKERFCHNHIDSSSTGKLHIKDENGKDFMCIDMSGELCNYTILGKTFIYDGKIMPGVPREYETNVEGLSITYRKMEPQPLTDSVIWMMGGLFCVSYENNSLKLNFNTVYEDVSNQIASAQKGEKFELWKEQEKETYISAFINKEIDNQVGHRKALFSTKSKDIIFNRIKEDLSGYKFQLNSVGAQSSIKYCVLTLIRKDESFYDFITKTSVDRNVKEIITTDLVNALSNEIFEDIFRDEMNLPDDWQHIIRSSVRDSIRSYLEANPVD